MSSQVLQSIPDVTLCRRVWEWCCLRIKGLLQTKSIHFPFDNQKLSLSVMSAFLFAVNPINPEEAISFFPDWKLPCLLFYSVSYFSRFLFCLITHLVLLLIASSEEGNIEFTRID